MESIQHARTFRGRGATHDGAAGARRPHSRNKQWVAPENGLRNSGTTANHPDSERWERGGHRGGGRGVRGTARNMRRFPNVSLHVERNPPASNMLAAGMNDTENAGSILGDSDMEDTNGIDEPEFENQEEREKAYQEVCPALLHGPSALTSVPF